MKLRLDVRTATHTEFLEFAFNRVRREEVKQVLSDT